MTVQHILAAKGRHVESVRAAATLNAVVQTLAAKRIGALVVVDGDGRIAGIVSERDVVRAFAAHGAGSLDDPVTTVMTRHVVTCTEQDDVAAVMRRMSDGKFRHVPVVDNAGRLAGIISIGDVVKHRLGELEAEANAMRDYIVMA